MVNLLYLIVDYCLVKTRIRLFGYLDNSCKVCVALLPKLLSRTNTKQCGGPLKLFFQKLFIVSVFGILRWNCRWNLLDWKLIKMNCRGIIPSFHIIFKKMSDWLTSMRNRSDGFLRFSILISLQECRQPSVRNQWMPSLMVTYIALQPWKYSWSNLRMRFGIR